MFELSQNTINLIFVFISLVISIFGGMFIQYKFNLWNKMYQKWAHWVNLGATAKLSMRFEQKTDFNNVKNTIKNDFITKFTDYRLLNEQTAKVALYFDEITVIITHDKYNEIFIEVMDLSSGINNLTNKIEMFFSLLTEVNENDRLFGKFISCDLSLQLPYKWAYVSIFEPKDFKLNDYVIKMVGTKGYKTSVEMRLNGVNATLSSLEEISFLLGKLL